MIVDGHVHLIDEGWMHEDFLVGMARMATAIAGKDTGEFPDPVELVKNLAPVLADPTGEKLVAMMDVAQVDLSCIFVQDTEFATGFPGVSIEAQNRKIVEACERFPDRFISLFSIDPRREGAVDLFSRAIEDWGMRGLKLHPASGFFPYEDCCYPLYKKCVEYDVPVLIHTGSQPAPLKSRFCLPIYVDDVAADFPHLPIIMAHVGHQIWEEALLVASVKPNIYFDISNWQIPFNRNPAEFYRMLRHLIDNVGPWRIFFASDGPYLNVLCPLDKWVQALKNPNMSSCPGVSFSTEEMEIILGKGFTKLFGIEGIDR